MKKLFFIALAVLCTANVASAQYRPEGKTLSTEVFYTPTDGGNGESKLSMPDYGIKVRMMLSDNFAARLSLGYATDGNKETTILKDGQDKEYNAYDRTSTSMFSIAPGVEYHFTKFDRVFPYIGVEVGLGFGSEKEKAWSTLNSDYTLDKSPITNFKVGVMAGFDVYLCKGLYTGLELGLAYQMKKTGRGSHTESYNGNIETNEGNTIRTQSNFGFYVVPSIKVGWHF